MHHARIGQRPGVANGMVINAYGYITALPRSGKRQPQRRLAGRLIGCRELDLPGGILQSLAAVAGGGIGIVIAGIFILADDWLVGARNSRRLDVVPVAPPVAPADDEIHVMRKFLGVIVV